MNLSTRTRTTGSDEKENLMRYDENDFDHDCADHAVDDTCQRCGNSW
jgi:hypothetical protein